MIDLVSINCLVDFPATSCGNKHIFSISNHFSKFTQLYPAKDRTALNTNRCLINFFMKFGIPYKLFSDSNPLYDAKLFQLLIRKLGAETGYNTREDGLIEKENELLKNHLISCSVSNKQEWGLWWK